MSVVRWYLITKRLCLIDSGQYSVEPLKPVRVLPQNNFFDMGIRIRWESLPILPSPPQRDNARCNSNHDTTFFSESSKIPFIWNNNDYESAYLMQLSIVLMAAILTGYVASLIRETT